MPIADVVAGDLVRVKVGDQVVADGTVVHADGLMLDQSILTGESEPVTRSVGEQVLSGSFAVEAMRVRGDGGRRTVGRGG